MALKGIVYLVLFLIPIVFAQEKRSLFDDLIPTTKLTKRHFDLDPPQQKLCDGRRSSESCLNTKKPPEKKDGSASSLFDELPKMSEPVKGKKDSLPSKASPSLQPSVEVKKYVPAPYSGQESSQSLFDQYMTKAKPPTSRLSSPSEPRSPKITSKNGSSSSSLFGSQNMESIAGESSSSFFERHDLESKTGGSPSSSFGRNGVSIKQGSIMEKEKEALENLSNYVWKEALQTSRFERDSSKDDLTQMANSAQKLKHLIAGGFTNDETESAKASSSKQIDRSFTESDDRRKLSNQDLRSLAKLLNRGGSQVSEDTFPETKQSFVPFLDEIKANRLKDLKLALKLMKSIQRTKDHRYAGSTRSEDFELNLAQLLFDAEIQSLAELTRTQRHSLEVLMKKMENTIKVQNDSSENKASLSQLLDESENDFSFGFFRPPQQSDPSRTYSKPQKPSGLYKTSVTARPPTPTRPPVRPPSPAPPRPPLPPTTRPPPPPPPTARPVGPPSPPVRPPSPPFGPPSVGPPAIRPPGTPPQALPFNDPLDEPLFLSSDFEDDERFFLAPSPNDYTDDSLDQEDEVVTAAIPAAPPRTYGAATEGRIPTSATDSSDSSAQANHNYHYHYHTLNINPNRRNFDAHQKPTRPLPTARDAGRTRRPTRLPLATQRRPSMSSYSSIQAAPAAPPVTFPDDPLPLEGEYGAPPRDPPAPPPPQYGTPQRDPPAPPPPLYGAPPRDPPAPPPPIYSAPPRDPEPPYRPPPADPVRQYAAPPRDPPPIYGPPPADPPPMDPVPPPRTQTRVVFLSPVKEKKKEKFWKKDNSDKGNFNAFSVLFDEETGLARQSDDSAQQPRDRSRGSDRYNNRRNDLRDQFWRNRERLFRQQQEAFDLQRLRLEIDLQERQRKEMKKGLFRSLLRDERSSDSGGGITSMFYKGIQALGAMALMPISNLIGRRKRDLASRPITDSIFNSREVMFENFPLKYQNANSSAEMKMLDLKSLKKDSKRQTKKHIHKPIKKYISKPLTNNANRKHNV